MNVKYNEIHPMWVECKVTAILIEALTISQGLFGGGAITLAWLTAIMSMTSQLVKGHQSPPYLISNDNLHTAKATFQYLHNSFKTLNAMSVDCRAQVTIAEICCWLKPPRNLIREETADTTKPFFRLFLHICKTPTKLAQMLTQHLSLQCLSH